VTAQDAGSEGPAGGAWVSDDRATGGGMRGFMGATTCLACLVAGWSAAAQADESSPTVIVFSRSGTTTPNCSIWNGLAWGPATAMPSVGGVAEWVVLRNCPTRDETVCATIDDGFDVNVLFHDRCGWGPATEVCDDTGNDTQRRFDAQYESVSGDLLVAYWSKAAAQIGYRTYSGGVLSGESLLALPSAQQCRYIAMTANPTSDEIILCALNNLFDLYTVTWDGAAWGSVTTIETNCETNRQESFSLGFESLSGEAVVVYSEKNEDQPRYRTWDGANWSSEGQLPNVGGDQFWIRLASDPLSNEILFASQDDGGDLNVNAWDGSSWGTNQELATALSNNAEREFDLSFPGGGGSALIAFREGTSTAPRFRTWNGSTWSAEQTAADIGQSLVIAQLRPARSGGEAFLAFADSGADLEVMRWDGAAMSPATQIEANLGGSATGERFMISVGGLTAANIPYANDFESAMGPEWSSALRDTSNGTFTGFAGRYAQDDGVTLALNTTIGETYEVVFDLYAIDSWEGTSVGAAPDYFDVTVDCHAVFHETFSNRPSTHPASYPFPADQIGALGFESGGDDVDGIYRTIGVVFTANNPLTRIEFSGNGLQPITDESWGIDNVIVDVALFRDVSAATGFDVQTTADADQGSGLHWADLDNDGDLDAVATGGASAGRFMNNSAGASFTVSNLGGGDVRRQAALLDIDNDGDVDLWTVAVADDDVERCFRNDGAGALTDIGDLGFSDPANNEAVVAGDVNGDGWCDVVMFSGDTGNWIGHHQGDPGASPPVLVGADGSGLGLGDGGDEGDGDYVSGGDVNNDDSPDFFYHFGGGRLFVSNGDGTYSENARGIAVTTGESDKVGSAWGDYDNDGDLDLFVPRHASGNTGYLWRNDVDWTASPASGAFSDETAAAEINGTAGQRSSAWGDYDNDGDLDLYVVTHAGGNVLYRNNGDGTFRHVNLGAADGGNGHDGVFVDYDNDGDLDIAITREGQGVVILENRTNDDRYLKVRVLGAGGGKTNAASIGTRVELWDADGSVLLARRDVGVARGYGGTEPLWLHFGGVEPAATYQVNVHFLSQEVIETIVPSATSTTIGSVTIPRMLTVQEPAGVKIIEWHEVANNAS